MANEQDRANTRKLTLQDLKQHQQSSPSTAAEELGVSLASLKWQSLELMHPTWVNTSGDVMRLEAKNVRLLFSFTMVVRGEVLVDREEAPIVFELRDEQPFSALLDVLRSRTGLPPTEYDLQFKHGDGWAKLTTEMDYEECISEWESLHPPSIILRGVYPAALSSQRRAAAAAASAAAAAAAAAIQAPQQVQQQAQSPNCTCTIM